MEREGGREWSAWPPVVGRPGEGVGSGGCCGGGCRGMEVREGRGRWVSPASGRGSARGGDPIGWGVVEVAALVVHQGVCRMTSVVSCVWLVLYYNLFYFDF